MPKPTSDCRATECKHPWPMVRLGDVCEFSRGLTYSKSDEVQFSLNVVLRSNNVDLETGRLVLDELKYIRDSIEIPTSKRVAKGAILMCTANGSKQHLGKVALIDGDYNYAFGGFMGLLTPNASIDSRYLYWQLMSFEFKRLVTTLTDGANINNLKFADISQFTFVLPPLSVQREIVARLERELAAVEKMKKGFEALAETAKAEFKAELKEVFEGLKSGGAGIVTGGTNGTVETRRLGEVCETITDGDHQPPPKSSQGVPFLVISNVASGRISFENTRFVPMAYYEAIQENRKPRKGDVLLTVTGSYGIPVVVETSEPFCFQRHIALIRASRLDSKFLAYALLSPDSKRYFDLVATGAAQKTIGLASIRAMSIPFPSLPVQRQIVARLSAAKARAEKLEAKAREGVAVCETMRKAILKEAFE